MYNIKSAYNTDFEEGKQYILKYKNRYFLSTVERYSAHDNIVYFKTRLAGKDKYLKIVEEDPKPAVIPVYIVKNEIIYQETELTEEDLKLYKLKPITLYNKATVPGYTLPNAPMLENYKDKRQYIDDLFKFYNKTFFNNKIKLSAIIFSQKILCNSGEQPYGLYSPHDNVLYISPTAIKDEEVFKETFIHELCHVMAYVETSKNLSYKENFHESHNHFWKKWMNHCGLKPERYVTYKDMVRTDNKWKKYDEALKEFGRTHKETKDPNVGQFVIVPVLNGKPFGGIIIKEKGEKVILDNKGLIYNIEDPDDFEGNKLFLMRKSDIKKFFKDMSFKKMKKIAGDELVEKGLNRMAASLFN